MDSILANIFIAVRTRLATLPELKFIDQDLGQLEVDDTSEREYPVKFPCALIDTVDMRYTDDSAKIQQGEGTLEIRVALTAYSAATHYYKKDIHTENALAYLNVEHRVNQLLHGWSDDQYFNPLSRVSATTEKRQDNIRVRVLRYTFGFRDYTAMKLPTQTIKRPDLEVQINSL